ncbi:MAG: cation/H(+) antiporter [Alphaproteobacteria bacterium]|nr:cation/H(+) antiporter [Alphaproteobacteria bacterium]
MEHAIDLTGLALVVLTALACGMVMARFRQPALVGYLVAGILLGPTGLGLVVNRGNIAVLAELGVLLLLFVVGMELSVRSLKFAWRIALPAVALQIAASVAVTMLISWGLGYPHSTALLLGFVVALSSTAVAVKMMAETGTLRTRVGRVTVAVLIAQDLAFLPMMLIVRQLGGGEFGLGAVLNILFAAGLLAAFILILSKRRHIQLPFARVVIGHADLSPLSGLVYCFGASALLGLVGLSPAYGAFLAGLAIGNSAQRKQMFAVVRPIESILVMVFFLSIGLLVDLPFIWNNLGQVLLLLLVVTLFKTALNIGILRFLRESWQRAFLGGLLISQIGEFSFLLAGAGLAVGAIDPAASRVVIAITVLSLCLSPFWLAFARRGQRLATHRLLSLRDLSLSAVMDVIFRNEVALARRTARRFRHGGEADSAAGGRQAVLALPGLLPRFRMPLGGRKAPRPPAPPSATQPPPPAPQPPAVRSDDARLPTDPMAEIGAQVRRAARLGPEDHAPRAIDRDRDDGDDDRPPPRRDGGDA